MNEGQVEMEQAVLACMASSPRIAARIGEILEGADLTVREHRIAFATMGDMLSEGTRIDELTLRAELRKDGYGDEMGAVVNGLYQTASRLASLDHAEEYATHLREESIRRALIRSADAALSEGEVEEVVSRLETATFVARSRMQGAGANEAMDAASILNPLESFLRAPEQSGGLPYPLPRLTRKYGLYQRGRYTILGGASGDGKSTMAFQWVEEMCAAGARVCIHEMEMTKLQVSTMLAVQGAGITQRQAKSIDPMSDDDKARLEDRKAEIAKWDIHVECGPSSPAKIRALQSRERFDVNVVDHMLKFPRTSAGEYTDLTNYSSQMHRITRDLDCSVILLAQLKQAQRDRQSGIAIRKEPTVADLRGGSQMEEDADDVLLMYQDRNSIGRRTGAGKLIVGKMREGQPDQAVPIMFDAVRTKFFEYDPHSTGAPSVLQQRQVEMPT